MGSPKPPAELVAQAQEAYEAGISLRDIGKMLDVSRETVRRWAAAGSWQAPMVMRGRDGQTRAVPSSEELEAARLRAEKARQESRARWAVRRADEADAAGLMAGLLRNRIQTAVGQPGEAVVAEQAQAAKSLAVIYGIFVDKAQLLSGEAPSRGRQTDDVPLEPRPTDPRLMVEAGRERALRLMPAVDAASTEVR